MNNFNFRPVAKILNSHIKFLCSWDTTRFCSVVNASLMSEWKHCQRMKRPDVISHLEVPLKPRHVFIKGSLGSETLRGGGPITRYRMTSPSTDSKDMLTTQKRAARTTHLGYRCQMCITTPQGKASRKYMANLYFNRQIKKRHIYI